MDKHHILVVDDNHINRLFFESSLKKMDSVVSLAENGYQAIEMCCDQNFDLILMDIRMDGLDGVQTANTIKALETHKNTPILAVSAEHFDCTQYPEFENCLLKPISQNKLKQILKAYLPKKNSTTIHFDEQLALQISHQDPHIVQKLRQLLIQQLPDDWLNIKQLYSSENWIELSAYLHKTLGSAKTCAALLLEQHIEQLKAFVDIEQKDDTALSQLEQAINKTMNAAGLSSTN